MLTDETNRKVAVLLAGQGLTSRLTSLVQLWTKTSAADNRWSIVYKKIVCFITDDNHDHRRCLIRVYDNYLRSVHWELDLAKEFVFESTKGPMFHVLRTPDGHCCGLKFADRLESNGFKILVLEQILKRSAQLSQCRPPAIGPPPPKPVQNRTRRSTNRPSDQTLVATNAIPTEDQLNCLLKDCKLCKLDGGSSGSSTMPLKTKPKTTLYTATEISMAQQSVVNDSESLAVDSNLQKHKPLMTLCVQTHRLVAIQDVADAGVRDTMIDTVDTGVTDPEVNIADSVIDTVDPEVMNPMVNIVNNCEDQPKDDSLDISDDSLDISVDSLENSVDTVVTDEIAEIVSQETDPLVPQVIPNDNIDKEVAELVPDLVEIVANKVEMEIYESQVIAEYDSVFSDTESEMKFMDDSDSDAEELAIDCTNAKSVDNELIIELVVDSGGLDTSHLDTRVADCNECLAEDKTEITTNSAEKLVDDKHETNSNANLAPTLAPKFDRQLYQKYNQEMDQKLNKSMAKKLSPKLNQKMDAKLNPKFNQKSLKNCKLRVDLDLDQMDRDLSRLQEYGKVLSVPKRPPVVEPEITLVDDPPTVDRPVMDTDCGQHSSRRRRLTKLFSKKSAGKAGGRHGAVNLNLGMQANNSNGKATHECDKKVRCLKCEATISPIKEYRAALDIVGRPDVEQLEQ
ncbi:unnamed protein product, partial [Medioppia subpectinata]